MDRVKLIAERVLKKSDSIFNKSDCTMNSCLNFSSDMTGAYTDGFKAIAQLGVEALKDKRATQDILVYPIVFCLRHHVELQLKQAIKHGYSFLKRKQKAPNIHEIDKLWCELRGILKEIKKITNQYPDSEEIKSVERIIQELAKLDPDGSRFRYAKSRNGADSIGSDIRILNLQSALETVEKLSFFLGSVEMHLHYLAEWKLNAEAEMMGNFYE